MKYAAKPVLAVLRVAAAVSLAFLLIRGDPESAAASGGRSSLGSVSVATAPAGASVFIDGHASGATPLRAVGMSAGDHRLRVVKAGYLENERVVTVAAGQMLHVNVILTPSPDGSDSAQVVGTQSSGGSRKWLWIAVAGGAAAGGLAVLANRNQPPTPGTITVSPNATGMAGLTSFAFTSNATDPDKDSLTYAWNFGDGATGSEANPTHTYSTAGPFNVSLAVSDGKQTANAPPVTVTVGPTLTGNWTGGTQLSVTGASCPTTLTLVQTNTALTGTLAWTGSCFGSTGLAASSVSVLQHPTAVSLQTLSYSWTSGNSVFSNMLLRFAGTTSSSGTTMSGTFTLTQTGTSFSNSNTTTFTKQ